jgi:hypothetical protein
MSGLAIILIIVTAVLFYRAGRQMTKRELAEVEELSMVLAGVAEDVEAQVEELEERFEEIATKNLEG